MSTKIRKIVSGNERTFVVGLVAFILVVIIMATTCIVSIKKKTDEPTTEPTTTEEKLDYEEIYEDRNVEESLIKFVVVNPDNGANPAVRSRPELKEETFIGRIKSGTEIYVSKAYKVEADTDNEAWIGVPYDEVVGKIEMPSNTYDRIEADRIVWVNGYYADVYCYDQDPGKYDSQDYKKYVRYEGEYTIEVKEACRLRSEPSTDGQLNVYGDIKKGTIIEANVIYKDGYNLFYGIPAKAIDDSDLDNRVGNVENDPDGIIWFSVKYAGTINPT